MDKKQNFVLTDRDKKLLRVLIVLLLVVGFIFLGIKPLWGNLGTLNDRKSEDTVTMQANSMREQNLTLLESQCDTLQTNLVALTQNYYSQMSSNEIDNLITGIVLGQELTSKSLTITMPETSYDVDPYPYSELAAQTAEDTGNYIENNFAVSLNQNADAGTTDAETEQTADGNVKLNSDLMAATVTVTVVGDRTKQQELIEMFRKDYPSIRVTAYSWDTETIQNVAEDLSASIQTNDTLNLTLEIYMYTGEGEQ